MEQKLHHITGIGGPLLQNKFTDYQQLSNKKYKSANKYHAQ